MVYDRITATQNSQTVNFVQHPFHQSFQAKLVNKTYEKNLQQRRQRLRNILSTEATLYQQELINDCKIKTEEAFASRENRLFGLKAERERQRQKFVEEMRVQQLMLVHFVSIAEQYF